jgi:uncharacterized protein (TIGR03435 family)
VEACILKCDNNRWTNLQAMARAAGLLLVCSLAYGQAAADTKSDAAKPEFEVATVKPSVPFGNGPMMVGMRGGPGTDDPGRLTITNLNLRDLIAFAYEVKRSQVSGGPPWLESERFDITAKVPPGATKQQSRVMMQNLLAERFKLAVHRETKEMAIYALVVNKGRPKMVESAADKAPSDAPPPPSANAAMVPPQMGKDGCPDVPASMAKRANGFMMVMPGGACMVDVAQTMAGLTEQLGNLFDRPVVDMTGLTGKYDFHLRFDPSSLGGRFAMMPKGPPPGGMGAPVHGPVDAPIGGPATANMEPAEAPPTIFVALQEQLGLKLDPRKGPADLLVIESVERTPAEN